MRPDTKKIDFLGFPKEKDGFSHQNHLFPRKKLVFRAQTILFLGKSWCSCPKPSFSHEKIGFPVQNHLFRRKKLVFLSKTILKTKKTIFLVSGRIVSQKMVFFVFPRKKMVFHARTIFFPGKVGFSRPNHLFPRKKLVFLSKTIFFPRKTLAFLSKTMFFLGKSWFSCPKPSFS